MTFIITGGGSGIGQALAINLANRGYKVLICGRREKLLQAVSSHFPKLITYIVGDITQKSTVSKITNYANSEELMGLIQNAGQIEPISELASMSLQDFKANQEINLMAPIQLFQALKDKLVGSRVLHISSLAAHVPFESWGAYCISKSSLFMLYQLLKKECPDISFGSVMPGITNTAMQSEIRNAKLMHESSQQFFIDLHDKNALLESSVVAQFLSWLLLDVSTDKFSQGEWDIYDKSHHKQWLKSGKVIPV